MNGKGARTEPCGTPLLFTISSQAHKSGLPPVSKVICDLVDCGKIHLYQPEFNAKLERQNDEKSIIEVNKQNTVCQP